jgi:hypothetical protein
MQLHASGPIKLMAGPNFLKVQMSIRKVENRNKQPLAISTTKSFPGTQKTSVTVILSSRLAIAPGPFITNQLSRTFPVIINSGLGANTLDWREGTAKRIY